MFLILAAYLGGVLTILSPCILPVLPFVFARSDQPFRRSGLPILAGMAITFAAVASLAAVGGGWVVEANYYGRLAAIVLMALFGITLLLPRLSERMTRPIVALGARLSQTAGNEGATFGSSLVLGVATGLLWAPCAGPILGLLLTGAALNGASLGTTFLLLAYAAGAATSLAVALLIGGKVFTAMKRSLGAGEWIRRGLGIAVLAGVVAIATGLDTGLLAQVSLASTNGVEQALVDRLHATPNTPVMKAGPTMMMAAAQPPAASLPVEGQLPSLAGAVDWLNSPPLTAESLRGHVVLVDFWTYSCINCLRTLPYVEAWAKKYHDEGLIVIGVHAPEFAFERNIDNVRAAVKRLGIDYPVAIDNNYAIWRGFNNEYWPAHYFIDADGRIRSHHFGEGDYAESEHVIQQLLREAGHKDIASGTVSVAGKGVEAAADMTDVESPETYIGTDRAENFASPGGADQGQVHPYTAPATLALNRWALTGDWRVGGQDAVLTQPDGGITYRFHARDLHLVLGPAPDGKPVKFQVLVDGHAPGDNHGVDTDADGNGVINAQRLYQLVRLAGGIGDHTFEIRFLDPGATAYSFTFG
ncbi:cytochrome c biogenesis protein DipZ [Acidisphaera sp. S103]|uniref:cytochrome c biogenesis protein DipZ n=1 Tax=Acidisphaera sp. S103 TaxID=1747223 RepID=UPI00131E1D4B|nr:cytochrome c biogenesis protein DipZ [Acidisphaera sp. S103]